MESKQVSALISVPTYDRFEKRLYSPLPKARDPPLGGEMRGLENRRLSGAHFPRGSVNHFARQPECAL